MIPVMNPLDKLMTKVDPLFTAPPFDETALPANLRAPATLMQLLRRRNGGYFYGGALHVFGACRTPAFHGLVPWNAPEAWRGPYGDGVDGLTFFAEDAFGDQFARDETGKVFVLRAEQGVVEELADDFDQWLLMAVEAPDELLGRGTFVRWVQAHGHLPHGSQLQAFPPFIFAEDADDVQLEAVDALDNMQFHATLAETIANLPEGKRLRVEFNEEGLQLITEDIPSDAAADSSATDAPADDEAPTAG